MRLFNINLFNAVIFICYSYYTVAKLGGYPVLQDAGIKKVLNALDSDAEVIMVSRLCISLIYYQYCHDSECDFLITYYNFKD